MSQTEPEDQPASGAADAPPGSRVPGLEVQALLAAIVTSSDDAIVSKDLNGIVQSWNAAAERIFGYSAQEMIGQSILKIIPPERPEEEEQILQRLRRGERIEHFETVRVRKDGQRIDVSVTISPVRDEHGRIIGASKIARDITPLKRMLAEREQLLASEQAARREAQRVSRMKDEFLATLSHELRTPLNAIIGWTHLLRSGSPGPAELAEGLQIIERNARIQAQLVEDLLDMSRLISGKMRLNVRTVDLVEVINSAVESVRPAADGKGIRLLRVLDPQAAVVSGDAGRLQQVLWNLLSNAIKFTPRGGQVQIMLRRVGSQVQISVADNGQGISPEFLPYLFTRFVQEDVSASRRHGGLGLGLAISRHLVEMHGGTISAFSAGPDQGATFTVSLPLRVMREPDEQQPSAPPGGSTAQQRVPPYQIDLSGVRVLVVDDEPDARELLRRVLEKNRAQVQTAESAAQALELLRRVRPDLVLADIGMPGEDGYQFIRKVRQLPQDEGGATPAVALTAFARSEDRRRALLAGYQMHVPKPVEPAELLAVIASVCGIANRSTDAP